MLNGLVLRSVCLLASYIVGLYLASFYLSRTTWIPFNELQFN